MGTSKRIVAMLLMMISLAVILIGMASWYYKEEREHCFKELYEYAESLGGEIRKIVTQDQEWLSRLAQMTVQHGTDFAEYAPELFALTDGIEPFSRMELILSDGSVLLSTGEQTKTDIAFSELAAAGAFISQRMTDPTDPKRMILRAYMPVEQNGQTMAILCGVVDLSTLPSLFTIDRFGGQAELYLVEGISGNFLLDTLHNTPGNREDVNGRKAKGNYDENEIRHDFQNQRAGTAIYYSNSAKEYLYTCYVPAGVADWIVMITVPESVAFERAQSLLVSFCGMGILLMLVFAVFFIWVLWDVRRERRVSEYQLQNIQYLLDVEETLFSAHVYPARFHIALQKIADFIGAETAFFWVVKQQSHIGQRIWSNHTQEHLERNADIMQFFPGLFGLLQEQGSFLSYDLSPLVAQYPKDKKTVQKMNLQSVMMIPVKNLEGELVGVLGATDLHHKSWKDTNPLEQVSLTFSMTINHYEIHQALTKMGQIDKLTGLKNRNAYQQTIEQFEIASVNTVACVYMDANGLHEINNHLGHDAGDAMLQLVADAMLCTFGSVFSYRLGGDEFVALCKDISKTEVELWAEQVRQTVEQAGYNLSVGVQWEESPTELQKIISMAELAMQEDKKQYYAKNGGERQMRKLNEQLAKMITEKQDADAFLSVLAEDFRGVYFVDIRTDQVRHIFMPPYFAQMLEETGGKFRKAMLLYAKRIVQPVWYSSFEQFCDYEWLSEQLKTNSPEFVYQRVDGRWLRLQVTNFQKNEETSAETLWIFSDK